MKMFDYNRLYSFTDKDKFLNEISKPLDGFSLTNTSENTYVIKRKKEVGFLYNSFSPELSVLLYEEGNTARIDYRLDSGVKKSFKLISVVACVLELFMIYICVLRGADVSIIFLCPIIYCIQLIFLVSGFRISCEIIDKRIRKRINQETP